MRPRTLKGAKSLGSEDLRLDTISSCRWRFRGGEPAVSISTSAFSIVSVMTLPINSTFFSRSLGTFRDDGRICRSGVPPAPDTNRHQMPEVLSPGFAFRKQIFFGPFVIALLVVASRRVTTPLNTTLN